MMKHDNESPVKSYLEELFLTETVCPLLTSKRKNNKVSDFSLLYLKKCPLNNPSFLVQEIHPQDCISLWFNGDQESRNYLWHWVTI